MTDPTDPLDKLCRRLHALGLRAEETGEDDPVRQAAVELVGGSYVRFLEATGFLATHAEVQGYVILTVGEDGVRQAAWADGADNLPLVEKLAMVVRLALDQAIHPAEDDPLFDPPPAGHA